MKRCRLIYRSNAVRETVCPECFRDIESKSQVNNQRDGIRSLLVFSNDQFLQVLEGPVRYVNQRYGKIVVDKRHENVEILSYELFSIPVFNDWSMRLVDLRKLGDQQKWMLRHYATSKQGLIIPRDPIAIHSLLYDIRAMSSTPSSTRHRLPLSHTTS